MIDPTPESTRYEIKLACAPEHLAEVRTWIGVHPALFTETFAPRQVNNIYLDTVTASDLGDHLGGVGRRQKVRFRWYGEDHTAVRGNLELKCRSGHLGWKLEAPIPYTFDLGRISWYDWMRQVRAYANPQALVWLSNIERPTLINAYRREYYEASEDQVRLTIDHPMSVYDQISHISPNFTFDTLVPRQVIVEVKAPLAHWRRLPEVLSRFPLRATRNSKYVRGMLGALSL